MRPDRGFADQDRDYSRGRNQPRIDRQSWQDTGDGVLKRPFRAGQPAPVGTHAVTPHLTLSGWKVAWIFLAVIAIVGFSHLCTMPFEEVKELLLAGLAVLS